MNTKKHKNKNKPKPVNPNPPQKEESELPEEKNEPEVVIKSQERVPEIISDVAPPVLEKPEEEAPKKPKRNRGKKKKSDKDNELDDAQQDVEKHDQKEPKPKKDSEGIIEDVSEAQKEIEAEVTPTTRKKKNKNKNKDESLTVKENLDIVKTIEVSVDENKIEVKEISKPAESSDQETKSSKKRNKKKKRNDSERSEEAVAVTAAFQKILEPKEDMKESKMKEKTDESKPIISDQAAQTESVNMSQESDHKILTQELKITSEIIHEGTKSKNKNKKDKKRHQSESEEDQAQKLLTAIITDDENTLSKEDVTPAIKAGDIIVKEQLMLSSLTTDVIPLTQDNKEKEATRAIEKEKSPKPKPKIAKPVDKKCKDKGEFQSDNEKTIKVEDIPISHQESKIELTTVDILTQKETEISTLSTNKDDETVCGKDKKDKSVHSKDVCSVIEKPEQINVPETKGDKKRKKSPKQQKRVETILPLVGEVLSKEFESKTSETFTEHKQLKTDSKIDERSKTNEELPNVREMTQTIEIPQTKPEKKRKKSPQPKLGEDIIMSTDIVSQKMEKATADESNSPDKKSEIIPIDQHICSDIELHKDAKLPKSTEKLVKLDEPLTTEKQATALAIDPFHINVETSGTSEKTENIKVAHIETKIDKHQKRKKSPKPHYEEKTAIRITQEECMKKPEIIAQTNVMQTINKPEPQRTESPLVTSEEPIHTKKPEHKKGKHDGAEPTTSKTYEMLLPDFSKGTKRSKSPKAVDLENKSPELKTVEKKFDEERIPTEGSVKSISVSPICDTIPDIEYPRCLSEVDDNNNLIIQEILIEQCKLNIPISIPDIPLVQGSGETPSVTPEVYCGITITDIDTQILRPDEKSDLKSKVLEVNKDMEELRKSIERSLAELTSIEKSEEEIEMKFEGSTAEIKNVQKQQRDTDENKKDVSSEKPINAHEKMTEPAESDNQSTVTRQSHAEPPKEIKNPDTNISHTGVSTPPIQPPRRENKGKNKKKKGKQDVEHSGTGENTSTTQQSTVQAGSTEKETGTDTKTDNKASKKEEKSDQKSGDNQEKGKQQSDTLAQDENNPFKSEEHVDIIQANYEPIEAFEDALTSSGDADDVNKTFEMMANEEFQLSPNETSKMEGPEINIISPLEDNETQENREEKINPVSQPKNLIGRPDIPVRSNKTDYKKEKNKTPNARQATIKIKDNVPIEGKQSKESQTCNKNKFIKDSKYASETVKCMTAENEEYVYKYSFRKVFLPNVCHVCKKELKLTRFPCNYCSLVFYCSPKHKDEDYPQHQALCFAVSTIMHLQKQKHIYTDAKNITGYNYRLLRMQMIVSCEKVLKRRLTPSEQETLLYPRMCADVCCREYRQGMLVDCEGCGQIAYCRDNRDHIPPSHQRWCRSYALYQKLVCYQQTKGRLEPKLPTRVLSELYRIPDKLNEVLASLYEEKIDMNDIEYAALTQIATAPLTAAHCYQLYCNKMNATYANGMHKKHTFTIHVVGAELQFEADALNKWELFFLHIRPDVRELRVVLIGPDLNPGQLPLDLLGKIRLCDSCYQGKRRVVFEFHDKKTYPEYWATDFSVPDLVCAFNPNIHRSSIYNGKDPWPGTIRCISKLKTPLVITSYTLPELQRDLTRVRECSDVIEVSPACNNPFASMRPDRNFVSDDEMPLLMKNYCFSIVCGV